MLRTVLTPVLFFSKWVTHYGGDCQIAWCINISRPYHKFNSVLTIIRWIPISQSASYKTYFRTTRHCYHGILPRDLTCSISMPTLDRSVSVLQKQKSDHLLAKGESSNEVRIHPTWNFRNSVTNERTVILHAVQYNVVDCIQQTVSVDNGTR